MTITQQKSMKNLRAELSAQYPEVVWFVSYNYYTKLPEIKAVKDGSIDFGMMKYWDGSKEMYAEFNPTSHLTQTGDMLVSNGGAEEKLKHITLERIDFKKYLQFVRDNLNALEKIGA